MESKVQADLDVQEKKLRAEESKLARAKELAEAEEKKLKAQTAALEAKKLLDVTAGTPTPHPNHAKPKLPPLTEFSQVDLYLQRFENYAKSMKWKPGDYASCLANLLQGEALSVFLSLSPEDISDYQSVKKTLLRRFGCDKNGFKSKFFSAKPSQDEDFATYINRVARYFNRWLELAQVSDFDSLSFLILSEIALQPCDAEFVAYIKDHSPTSLSDLKTQATSYLDARPSKSFIRDSATSFAGESIRPTARSDSRRPSIHSYRSQTHKRANTPSLGRHTSHTSSGHRPPTHGVHSFDAKFNRDGRLHIESASLFGSKCSLLRDTGCNTVGVRRSLVPVSSITGRRIKVNTFCCENRAFDTAVIDISSPYFSGRVEACLLTNPVADVILGDIDGIIDPTPSNSYSGVDGSVPSACVVTRARARKTIDNNSQNNMVPSYDPSAQSQLIHTALNCVPLADVDSRQKVDPTLKDWFNRYQFVIDFHNKLKAGWQLAASALKEFADKSREHQSLNPRVKHFAVDDQVLVLLPSSNNKLSLTLQGPFNIAKKLSPVVYLVDFGHRVSPLHVNLLRKYHRDSPYQIKQPTSTVSAENTTAKANAASHQPTALEPELLPFAHASMEFDPFIFPFGSEDIEMPSEMSPSMTAEDDIATTAYVSTVTEDSITEFGSSIPTPSLSHDETLRVNINPCLDSAKVQQVQELFTEFQDILTSLPGLTTTIHHVISENIPLPEDLFMQMSKSEIFSTCDLAKAYWQIPLEENIKKFTAFQTPLGLMQWIRMPFGLVTAPATFYRLMRLVIGDRQNFLSYFDDTMTHTRSLSGHLTALRTLFSSAWFTCQSYETVYLQD
ncbi:Zinc finger protein [Plakobranchus ocellatus]|uniref:Zinc finger protein n=1 Tax=Plakobranchus ocellatus TaxID=259542 RepID=A0AAV4AFI9_9GAST|nr:Zinc finger protein [Plakobranchus ocellatus]